MPKLNLFRSVTAYERDLDIARHETGWTTKRQEIALLMWSDGYSASQIAVELGGVTRNAVISRIHRSADKRRPHAANGAATIERMPKPQRAATVRTPARPKLPTRIAEQRKAIYGRAPKVSDADIPQEQRRQLLDLDATCCHWPVGDPRDAGFFYCGALALEARPYCLAHCARAYEPRPPREPRREGR